MGERREIPITPELRLGAEPARRIYASDVGKNDRPRQLTNDPRYSDEEPVWSGDGSHILFCRVNTRDAWTIC